MKNIRRVQRRYPSFSFVTITLTGLIVVAASLAVQQFSIHFHVSGNDVSDSFTKPKPLELPWGSPQNLTADGISVAIASISSAISRCPEFQCSGWPGRRNCTGVLPNPTTTIDGRQSPIGVHWSVAVREKDCSRTKLGSWDFDANGNIDIIVFYLFFLPELLGSGIMQVPPRTGVAVEFGAQNGIDASNSRFYERHLGWETLLVEPTSCYLAVRRNRPRASVVHGAVCRERKNITLPGSSKWCGSSEGTGRHKIEEVQCYPLRQLFETHGRLSLIDFLSIDSEGMELEALESIDFTKVDIRVLVVEWRKEDGSKRREFMQKFGYEATFIGGADELFWRPDLFRRESDDV